jgi:hypothetical protein
MNILIEMATPNEKLPGHLLKREDARSRMSPFGTSVINPDLRHCPSGQQRKNGEGQCIVEPVFVDFVQTCRHAFSIF